ncbi:hypothetical protein FACS1894113_0060 [Alphaproteobacteria bacterium]|nr:hypothetical protein FACS1894113_0060 [Alphaproteobacteria bacterium]
MLRFFKKFNQKKFILKKEKQDEYFIEINRKNDYARNEQCITKQLREVQGMLRNKSLCEHYAL